MNFGQSGKWKCKVINYLKYLWFNLNVFPLINLLWVYNTLDISEKKNNVIWRIKKKKLIKATEDSCQQL